jgi:conserved oligomeric Golgi complex subunit 8
MADILHDVLIPRPTPGRDSADPAALTYLGRLAEQTPESLHTTEPQQLSQSLHSLVISLQALSKRSHSAVIGSANHHISLRTTLPSFAESAADLGRAIPKLDAEALRFATMYSKSGENDALLRRKKALALVRNVDRLVDVLELPTLLSSAISATPANYSSALDLNSHIRRLHGLYPNSPLVDSVSLQAEQATHKMAADLVVSLKTPNLKLAASLRTVGWLRRVVPDLEPEIASGQGTSDRVLGSIFLLCRLATLSSTLSALQPLRDLADEERTRQAAAPKNSHSWSGGQQTERYLKRYVEIFREQSFGIISMFKSVFPNVAFSALAQDMDDPLQPPAPPLTGFPLHLVEMLMATLHEYLPWVRDRAARDSILTQVLYCSGSLGRLGGDFGVLLSKVCMPLDSGEAQGSESEGEWVEVVKRHRLLAGRLESVIGDHRGVNTKDL